MDGTFVFCTAVVSFGRSSEEVDSAVLILSVSPASVADTDFNGSNNSPGGGVAVPPVEDLILSLLDVEVVRGRSMLDFAAKAISSNFSKSLVVVVLLLVGASSATSDMYIVEMSSSSEHRV